jgi:hypothetical protein
LTVVRPYYTTKARPARTILFTESSGLSGLLLNLSGFASAFAFFLVRNSEFLTTLGPAAAQNCSTGLGSHALSESVRFRAFFFVRLICSFGHIAFLG